MMPATFWSGAATQDDRHGHRHGYGQTLENAAAEEARAWLLIGREPEDFRSQRATANFAFNQSALQPLNASDGSLRVSDCVGSNDHNGYTTPDSSLPLSTSLLRLSSLPPNTTTPHVLSYTEPPNRSRMQEVVDEGQTHSPLHAEHGDAVSALAGEGVLDSITAEVAIDALQAPIIHTPVKNTESPPDGQTSLQSLPANDAAIKIEVSPERAASLPGANPLDLLPPVELESSAAMLLDPSAPSDPSGPADLRMYMPDMPGYAIDHIPLDPLQIEGQAEFSDLPAGPSLLGQQRAAYAKLEFEDGDYYMNTIAIELGRDFSDKKPKGEKKREGDELSDTPRKKLRYSRSDMLSEKGGIAPHDSDIAPAGRSHRSASETARPVDLTYTPATGRYDYEGSSYISARDPDIDDPPRPFDPAAHLPDMSKCVRVPIHPPADVGPKGLSSISRTHARIEYNEMDRRFQVHVLGRNGLYRARGPGLWADDDVEHWPKGSVVPLFNRDRLQIGSVRFTFLLPIGEDSSSDPPSPTGSGGNSFEFGFENSKGESIAATGIDSDEETPSILDNNAWPSGEFDDFDDFESLSDDEEPEQLLPQARKKAMQKPMLKLKTTKPGRKDTSARPSKVQKSTKHRKGIDKKRKRSMEKPPQAKSEPPVARQETPPKPKATKTLPKEPVNEVPVAKPVSDAIKEPEKTAPSTGAEGSKSQPNDFKATVVDGSAPVNGAVTYDDPEILAALGLEPGTQFVRKSGPGRPPKDGVMSKRERGLYMKIKKEKQRAELEGRDPKEVTLATIDAQKKQGQKPRKMSTDPTEAPPEDAGESPTQAQSIRRPSKVERDEPPEEPDIPESEIPEADLVKPADPYLTLIHQVLSAAPNNELNLQNIYKEICRKWPYYKYRVQTKGWESSVRHNLIGNAHFIKVEDKERKETIWRLDKSVPLAKQQRRRAEAPPVQQQPQQQMHQYPAAQQHGPQYAAVPGTRPPPPSGLVQPDQQVVPSFRMPSTLRASTNGGAQSSYSSPWAQGPPASASPPAGGNVPPPNGAAPPASPWGAPTTAGGPAPPTSRPAPPASPWATPSASGPPPAASPYATAPVNGSAPPASPYAAIPSGRAVPPPSPYAAPASALPSGPAPPAWGSSSGVRSPYAPAQPPQSPYATGNNTLQSRPQPPTGPRPPQGYTPPSMTPQNASAQSSQGSQPGQRTHTPPGNPNYIRPTSTSTLNAPPPASSMSYGTSAGSNTNMTPTAGPVPAGVASPYAAPLNRTQPSPVNAPHQPLQHGGTNHQGPPQSPYGPTNPALQVLHALAQPPQQASSPQGVASPQRPFVEPLTPDRVPSRPGTSHGVEPSSLRRELENAAKVENNVESTNTTSTNGAIATAQGLNANSAVPATAAETAKPAVATDAGSTEADHATVGGDEQPAS